MMYLYRLYLGLLLMAGLGKTTCLAQYFLSAASGNSGIIVQQNEVGQGTAINYSSTDTRFGITAPILWLDSLPPDKQFNSDNSPRIPNSTQLNIYSGVSVSQGIGTLISKGKFSPGLDAAADIIRFIERRKSNGDDDGGYNALFARVKLALTQNKYALPESPTGGSVIQVDSKPGPSLGVGIGFNSVARDEEERIGGISAFYSYNWNSTDGLKKRMVSVQTIQGVDNTGKPVYVNETEERYYGSLADVGKFQLRADGIIKLGNFKKDANNAIIGLMGSVSVDVKTQKSAAFNVAFGPSLHVSKLISQTIAALLVEGTDITNAYGENPKLSDRLSVKVYIGVPFAFLK